MRDFLVIQLIFIDLIFFIIQLFFYNKKISFVVLQICSPHYIFVDFLYVM